MTKRHCLFADQGGASAVEFALVLPLFLVLLFLSIDGGRYLYNINRLEKATQYGARFAVVTYPVASDLAGIDYVGQVVDGQILTQGDRIPADALTTFTCNSTSCTGGHTFDTTHSPQPFTSILTRMQAIMPELTAANVTITYSGSGLGYAGDPSGMQISPLVTVTVSGLTWKPMSGFMFVNAQYPSISATLSAEDSVGSQSY
jgi:Flp pilus assembly protein TadG